LFVQRCNIFAEFLAHKPLKFHIKNILLLLKPKAAINAAFGFITGF